jgi:hypothetical protein
MHVRGWVWRVALKALSSATALLPVAANCTVADILGEYSGYTIAAAKRVAGYIDKDGKKSDDFEGCEYDRQIVFDDGSVLICSSYHYHYTYHPLAAILIKTMDVSGQRFATIVMIVGDDAYEMRGSPIR